MAPHIFVLPLPIHGHLNPSLHLSMRLAQLGCQITLVTTASTRARAESVLLDASNVTLVAMEDDMRVNPNVHESSDGELGGRQYTLRSSIIFMNTNLHQLQRLIQDSQPISSFIVDFLLLSSVKEILDGAKVCAFFFSSAAMLHIVVNIHRLFDAGYLPKPPDPTQCSNREIQPSTIPGIPFKLDLYRDIPAGDHMDPTFKIMRSLRPVLQQARCVLINTYDALEHNSLQALQEDGFNVEAVGPLVDRRLSSKDSDGDKEIMKWLGAQSMGSVVYISFGTMVQPSPEQAEEIRNALVAMRRPFLWAFDWKRPEVAAMVADIRGRISEGMMSGMIVEWSPQQRVLLHPSVGVFLTHCGWNSTLEAASSGVAMVGWPQAGTDQPVNLKFVVEGWGIGRSISSRDEHGRPRLVRSEEIGNAIDAVMEDVDGIRAKAKSVAALDERIDLREKMEKYDMWS